MEPRPTPDEGLLAWHFLPADRRLTHGDGRRVEVGQTLQMPDHLIAPGHRGFHASRQARAALVVAPGPVVCRVRMTGRWIQEVNQVVASRRTVLWMADATPALHRFSLVCAESVLKQLTTPDDGALEALQIKRRWLEGSVPDRVMVETWESISGPSSRSWQIAQLLSQAMAPSEVHKTALETSEAAIAATLNLQGLDLVAARDGGAWLAKREASRRQTQELHERWLTEELRVLASPQPVDAPDSEEEPRAARSDRGTGERL